MIEKPLTPADVDRFKKKLRELGWGEPCIACENGWKCKKHPKPEDTR